MSNRAAVVKPKKIVVFIEIVIEMSVFVDILLHRAAKEAKGDAVDYVGI